MKKIVFLALSLLFLASCGEDVSTQDEMRQERLRELASGFEVVEIDSCEYLIKEKFDHLSMKRGYGFMAHKGNCKFCEERRKEASHEDE